MEDILGFLSMVILRGDEIRNENYREKEISNRNG